MGYTETELFESDRDVIDELLRRTGFGVELGRARSSGTVRLYETARLQFADLSFATPSGRIELASAAAVAAGQPRLPEPWHDPRPVSGRLRLLSPASPWALNSSFANDPKIARKLGPPTVTLHPSDAAARGLAARRRRRPRDHDGTAARASSSSTHSSLRGVAYCPKGHWPKLTADNANVNTLNPGDPADMARSTSVHGIEITVTRSLTPLET